jgi:hypothetical protein
MMNVKIVPYQFKVAPYWSFINFILQLSNVKPTQVCSAPAGRQVISTTLYGGTSKGIT